MVVDKPNVRSVVFKEQEGSYLVGVTRGDWPPRREPSASSAAWTCPADPQVRLRLRLAARRKPNRDANVIQQL
jgi:hypothetical protein